MNCIPTNLNREQAELLTTLLQDSMRLLRDAASPSPISTQGGYSIIAQRIEDVLRACGADKALLLNAMIERQVRPSELARLMGVKP